MLNIKAVLSEVNILVHYTSLKGLALKVIKQCPMEEWRCEESQKAR